MRKLKVSFTKCVELSDTSEVTVESEGPLTEKELTVIVNKIRHHASEESLEVTGDEPTEDVEDTENLGCSDCYDEPCSCNAEGSKEVDVEDQELSSSNLEESVKNALVALKVNSNSWETKEEAHRYLPIILNIFPDLARGFKSDIPALVNCVLNRLHKLDFKTLVRLDKTLAPLSVN